MVTFVARHYDGDEATLPCLNENKGVYLLDFFS